MKAGHQGRDFFKTATLLLFVLNLILVTSSLVTSAVAGDWSLTSVISEDLSFNENVQLEEDDAGATYGSTTNINNTVNFADRTLNLQFNSALSLREFIESGGATSDDLDSLDQRYSGNLSKRFKKFNVNFGGGVSITDTVFNEFDESGILDQEDTNRISITGTGGINYSFDKLTDLTFDASVNDVSFSEDSTAFTPFLSTNFTAGVRRRLTKKLAARFSQRVAIFSPEGLAATPSRTISSTVGLDTQLTKALALNVSGGLSFITQDFDNAASETSLSNEFEIDFSYALKNTSLGISFSRSNDPSSLGELQTNDRLRISAQRQITKNSRFSVAAVATRRESAVGLLSTDRDALSISSSYSRDFRNRWQASLAHTFRFQDDTASSASSNNINLSVSRQFDFKL